MGSMVQNVTHLLDNQSEQFWKNVRTYHHMYEYALAVLSFALNGWVIYLALTTKNRTMRNFCWVLLMSVLGDLLYTTFNFVSMMVVEVRNGKMYFLTMGPFIHSDYPYNVIMASLWLSGMYVTIVTILMQFVYRYFALCRDPLTPPQFAFLYGACLSWSFLQGFMSFAAFDGQSVEDTMDLLGHPAYGFDPPAYVVGNPDKKPALIHFISSQILIIIFYFIMYYTGRRIKSKLNAEAHHMSKATKEAQEKLNQVMMLQAIYPGVILGMPVIVATLITQLQMDAWWSGLYLVTSISVIPLANSLTVLVVIPTFRRRVNRFIRAMLYASRISDSKVELRKSGTTSDMHSRDEDDDHVVF